MRRQTGGLPAHAMAGGGPNASSRPPTATIASCWSYVQPAVMMTFLSHYSTACMCQAWPRLLGQPQHQQTGHVRHAHACTLTSSLTSWRVLYADGNAMHPDNMPSCSDRLRRFTGIGVSS